MENNYVQKLPGGHCYYCHKDYPNEHDWEACKAVNEANYRDHCDERCKDSKFYKHPKPKKLDLNLFQDFPDNRTDDAAVLARKLNEIIDYLN